MRIAVAGLQSLPVLVALLDDGLCILLTGWRRSVSGIDKKHRDLTLFVGYLALGFPVKRISILGLSVHSLVQPVPFPDFMDAPRQQTF
jgi:hypothetical protein